MGQRDFSEQVVWITGASAGIGRELARDFARRGAAVALSARRTERLEALAAELRAAGTRVAVVPCDVRQETAVEAAAGAVLRELGRLDVAVANAGFSVQGTVESLSAEDWRRQLDTNVVGVAMTARYALPALRETRGRLVIVGSVMSMLALPGHAPYCASKYALRGLGQALAMECQGSGVTVTLIHPGFVESEIGQVDNAGTFHDEREDRRPEWLRWPTDKAARVMLDAIHARRREYTFTAHGRLGAFAGQHFPGLVQRALSLRPH